MIPNCIDDTKAAKGNMAVCSEHFPQNCRFNDKEGIHRRPIDPPSIFHIKETSCIGTPAPKPRYTTKANAFLRRDDAKIDPDKEHKDFLPKNKIRSLSQYLKLCFVWHNATSISF